MTTDAPAMQLDGYILPMRSELEPEGLARLREAGYPTTILVIDFETYFDDEYKMMGKGDGLSTIEYVMDSRFEILGCSFLLAKIPYDYAADTFFQAGEEMVSTQIKCYQKLYGDNLEHITVGVQNAPFDAMVLSRRFGIHPPFIVDTLDLARHWNSRANNDLDTQCKRWKLPPKGDTEQFRGLTFRTRFKKPKSRKKGPKLPVQVPKITSEQTAKLAEYANNDVMRQWELTTILLAKLSRPTFELQVMRSTLDMYIRPMLAVDQAKGDELIVRMNAILDGIMADAGATREEISGDNSFMGLLSEALLAAGDNPMRYMKQGSPHKVTGERKTLLAIAQDDPERKLLENHADDRVKQLMAARIALDAWPKHIKRVQRIQGQARAAGGLLPVPLKYHGAHTGRDSGGQKINLQNLGSKGHPLVSEMREMLIAPAGKKLAIVDMEQIEARVLAWVAGQDDLLERFRNGVEIYCGFATKVLGWKVRKPIDEGKPGYIQRIDARHKWARNSIGKVGILGCGYGMGTDRIFEYAEGKITIETANSIKVTYRAEHQYIVAFWRDIEKAFIYTAKYGQPCEMPRGLRFHATADCDVVITLPSGREIHYHKVKLVPGQYSDTIEVYNEQEHHWGHVWGGHLTENVVQAIARDLLMEAAIRLGDAGYPTALRVHDELVLCTEADRADLVLKATKAEMCRVPAWGAGLPLGAAGKITDRYGGH